MNDASESLDRYREKWREAPRGSDMDGRIFSSDLLALPDDRLLAAWEEMAARRYIGEIAWLHPLYSDTFRGRKVIELGSGLGFDGLRFAGNGASWTFADIVPDNLALIRRVAGLKGLQDRVLFHVIGDDLSFDALPRDYDAIWACGSLINVPFAVARREALDVLGHLKPGGRWIELVYPRERWLREGAPPFEEWGKVTDGERTPWVEWNDLEKVRRRLFPAPLFTLLDFEFCSHNYRWLDLQYTGGDQFRLADFDLDALSRTVDLTALPLRLETAARRRPLWNSAAGSPWSVLCPAGLFARAASVDLAAAMPAFATAPGVAVDLEIEVSRGAVGVGFVDEKGDYLPAAETVVEAGADTRLMTLRAVGTGTPATLVFRNLRDRRRSAFTVRSALLRVAT